jgi:hypothetical protein
LYGCFDKVMEREYIYALAALAVLAVIAVIWYMYRGKTKKKLGAEDDSEDLDNGSIIKQKAAQQGKEIPGNGSAIKQKAAQQGKEIPDIGQRIKEAGAHNASEDFLGIGKTARKYSNRGAEKEQQKTLSIRFSKLPHRVANSSTS